MFINGEQADGVRAAAVKYVTDVLPFQRGDHAYQEICKGYGAGYGTTCTFLPHWMMARIGVSASNMSVTTRSKRHSLINRKDDPAGTTLTPGEGISLLTHSPAFVTMKAGVFPLPGDIVVIQRDPYFQPHEHTFVFLGKISDKLWDTGESGQARSNATNGATEALRKQREMKIEAKKMTAVGSDGIPDRYVQGWLDISKLAYDSLP